MEFPSHDPIEGETSATALIYNQEKSFGVRSPKSYPRSDLRALINTLMPKSKERAKRTPEVSLRKINLDNLNSSKLQETVSTPKSEAKPTKTKLTIKTLSVEKYSSDKSEKLEKLTLREKRLNDAKFYRTFQVKDSPTSQEKISPTRTQSLGCSIVGKSHFLRQLSPSTSTKKHEVRNEVNMIVGMPFIPRHEDQPEVVSAELSPNAYYLARQARKIGSPTHMTSQSCERTPKLKDDAKEIEEWKKNYSEAADPMYDPKLRSKRMSRFSSDSVDVKDHQNDDKDDPMQRIKRPYAEFIKKNFDGSMVGRLETFGTFAFTSVEREDNREIPAFLNETKPLKEPLGSMGVVDLWSHRLVNELAKRANFSEEKRMIEKFAFYRAKEMKGVKTKKPQFMVLHRKNENIYKDIIARKEFVQFQKKNEEITNMSSMKRHLSLQGKTFYKGKECSNEPTLIVDSEMKEIQGELACIFNDLNQFAEKNQDDYLKLIESSSHEKKRMKQRSKSQKGLEQINKLREEVIWKDPKFLQRES